MFLQKFHSYQVSSVFILLLILSSLTNSQTNFYPSVRANFGIRSAQLSGVDSSGMDDWAQGVSGNGVILNNGTPDFANYPNTAHIKDRAVGQGESSAFTSTSKSGDKLSTWTVGVANVSGKTDIVNAYAHARRDAQDSLWFFIAAERVTTNGATTVDFEFLKAGITVNANGTISALGPDSGRTAGVVTTPVINGGGTVSKPGDLLLVTEYGGSSVTTEVYMWTKNPPAGVTFDQGTGVSPYGWALINPPDGAIIATQNASSVQSGPWGTFQGSGADSTTTLEALAFVEVGVNMTKLKLDADTLTCANIGQAIVHSRTSPSFSSGLADFAGPLSFSLNTCVTLTLQKFEDTDGLISSTNDQNLKNWNLSIYKNSIAAQNLVATVASGNTLGTLDTLKKGTYIVTEADSSGWSHLGVLETSDVNGNVTHTSTTNSFSFVGAAGDSLTLKFINTHSASIAGQKFKDANGNGAKDVGETGLSGWTIQLQNTSGTVLASTTTDGSGNYTFAEVTPGVTYRVREVQQPGWTQSTPNPSDITPTSSQQITDINFGNAKLTTVSVTTSPNPSQRFESVTISATVSPSEATGTVEFFDGVTSLGSAAVNSGTAFIATSTLPGGDHSITAVYSGDSQFNGSTSPNHTHVVIRSASSTTISSSLNPSVYGQAVTFTATVSPSNATGQIEFFADNNSIGVVSVASGSAAIITSSLFAGSHTLIAQYGGDADIDTSTSSPLTQVVNQVSTTTSISAPAITYNANGSVTVTVSSSVGTPTGNVSLSVDGGGATTQALVNGSTTFTLSSPSAGDHSLNATFAAQGNYAASNASGSLHVNPAATSVSISAPTVTFNTNGSVSVTVTSASGTVLGDVSLSVDGGASTTQTLSGGSTTFTLSSPSAGDHSLSVTYAAQGNFDASSGTGNLHVNQAATSPSISAPTITYNANGSVTISVTSSAGTVTGNVSLSVDGGAATTQPLSNGSSVFTLTSPNAGDHSLSATFAAQGNFDASSASGNLHVNPAPTSISLDAPTITYGANGSVTLTVSSASGVPAGTISLSVDGGAAQTQTLTSGVAVFTVNNPAGGSHTLSATYAAQGNFDASSASGTLQVNKASTSTSVASSLNPSILGQSVTFTATVTLSAATGTVEFFDGVTSLGTATLSSGSASVSTSNLNAADHSITAVYSGDQNFNGSTSPVLTQSVLNPVPFTTSINPSTQSIGAPTFTLTVFGGNFISSSVVRFNGSDRTTTFVSATEVQTTILTSDVSTLGEYPITVFNPTPGGGLSNAQTLTVVGASISGMKFNDLNGDGVKDENEPGIANWSIAISGPLNDTVQTNGNGQYIFNLVLAGTYTVTEVQQSGWQQTTSSPAPITIAIGEIVTGVNFGNFKSPKISGYKFEDANGNGVFDESESGLEGWTINAVNGVQNKSTTTAADGSYSFTFSTTETGTWTLSEVLQSGWLQLFPPSGTHSVLAVSAVDTSNVNFGNYHPASISGKKYEDIAGDSSVAGDPTLNGWTIELYKNSILIASTVSSGDGDYTFDSLSPGSYTIQEVSQEGWIQTYPASGSHSVTISSGENSTGYDFGNFELGSISGLKFEDINGDSLEEVGEPALEGWVIRLSKGETLVEEDTSDATGNYSFSGLTAGTYDVSEVQQSEDWYHTVPPTVSYTLTISSGSIFTGKNFGNVQFGTVFGSTYRDYDSSGTFDAICEEYLAGQKIVLVGSHTAPETTTTDSNGNFTFDPVPADVYTLKGVDDAYWRQTNPANGNPYSFQLLSRMDTGVFVFGNFFILDTNKFRTFTVREYNKAAGARQKSGFSKKPTAGNVRDSAHVNRGFDSPTGYMLVGVERPDSSLVYGWYYYKLDALHPYKASAVKLWFYNTHWIKLVRYNKLPGKPLLPKKPTNYITAYGEKIAESQIGNAMNYGQAHFLTFKTNIAASDLGITPQGYGELIYGCAKNADFSDSVLVGKTLREISHFYDTVLTMGRLIKSIGDTVYRYPPFYLRLLDSVAVRLNLEFSQDTGKTLKKFIVDTTSTNPLKVKGWKSLYKASYLHSVPDVVFANQKFERHFTAGESQPGSYRLEQNYPNPFNPLTLIRYQLSGTSSVTLKVYDILGREVVTLLDDEELEKGVHEIEFDAANFASGVYYYKIEVEQHDEKGTSQKFTNIKKMLLMR